MAFSKKKYRLTALRKLKYKKELYKKSGKINSDEGKNLVYRIEGLEKKIHDKA